MRVVWLRLSEAGFAIGVWAMNRLPDEPMTEAQRARMAAQFERCRVCRAISRLLDDEDDVSADGRDADVNDGSA